MSSPSPAKERWARIGSAVRRAFVATRSSTSPIASGKSAGSPSVKGVAAIPETSKLSTPPPPEPFRGQQLSSIAESPAQEAAAFETVPFPSALHPPSRSPSYQQNSDHLENNPLSVMDYTKGRAAPGGFTDEVDDLPQSISIVVPSKEPPIYILTPEALSAPAALPAEEAPTPLPVSVPEPEPETELSAPELEASYRRRIPPDWLDYNAARAALGAFTDEVDDLPQSHPILDPWRESLPVYDSAPETPSDSVEEVRASSPASEAATTGPEEQRQPFQEPISAAEQSELPAPVHAPAGTPTSEMNSGEEILSGPGSVTALNGDVSARSRTSSIQHIAPGFTMSGVGDSEPMPDLVHFSERHQDPSKPEDLPILEHSSNDHLKWAVVISGLAGMLAISLLLLRRSFEIFPSYNLLVKLGQPTAAVT